MWHALNNAELGLMNVLSDSINREQTKHPSLLPNLHSGKTLLIASDYSGHHNGCHFESYSFLLSCLEDWPEWEAARLLVRQKYSLDSRRFAFKKLGDTRKREALDAFLGAAHRLPGLCATVLIEKSIESMFRKEGRLNFSSPDLNNYAHYGTATFERLLRVAHFVSLFIAGLSAPKQNVLWFTDQDNIAANPNRLTELTQIWAMILSNYLSHDLGHIRCGTTESDDGTLQIEDLAAVPDLFAGALAEVLTAYQDQGYVFVEPIVLPPPQGVSSKTKAIMRWLSGSFSLLKHLVYVIEPQVNSTALRITRLNFHI